jgi:hypothetical protein
VICVDEAASTTADGTLTPSVAAGSSSKNKINQSATTAFGINKERPMGRQAAKAVVKLEKHFDKAAKQSSTMWGEVADSNKELAAAVKDMVSVRREALSAKREELSAKRRKERVETLKIMIDQQYKKCDYLSRLNKMDELDATLKHIDQLQQEIADIKMQQDLEEDLAEFAAPVEVVQQEEPQKETEQEQQEQD